MNGKVYIYKCIECGEEYEKHVRGTFYCDWFDCPSDEPLELQGERFVLIMPQEKNRPSS